MKKLFSLCVCFMMVTAGLLRWPRRRSWGTKGLKSKESGGFVSTNFDFQPGAVLRKNTSLLT